MIKLEIRSCVYNALPARDLKAVSTIQALPTLRIHRATFTGTMSVGHTDYPAVNQAGRSVIRTGLGDAKRGWAPYIS